MKTGKTYLVSTVEPIPELDGQLDEWRTQQIAQSLTKVGVNVIFLVSSFDHYRKIYRSAENRDKYKNRFGAEIVFIPSIGYRNNVSLRRVVNYWFQAIWLFFYFLIFSRSTDRLLLTIPAIEHLIARYSFRGKTVIDYRDLWPRIFHPYLYGLTGFFARAYIKVLEVLLKRAFIAAHAIITISEEFKNEIIGMAYNCEEKIIVLRQYRSMPKSIPVRRPLKCPEWQRSNIVYAGKISSRTNVLESVKEISQNTYFEGTIFVCGSGDGDEIEKLNVLCTRAQNVQYLGSLEKRELEKVYAESSFGLIPYKSTEDLSLALPNKFFEYLSNNLFVLHHHFKPIVKFREKNQLIVDVDMDRASRKYISFEDLEAAQKVVKLDNESSMLQVSFALAN